MENKIDVPNIPLEDFEIPSSEINSILGIRNEYVGSIEFGVIGAGQCGGRIAKSFYDLGYKKTIAINTAKADLNPLAIPDNQKMLIGELQGSGKDMEKGEKACKEAKQRILDAMLDVFGTVDKIIICVGFGGGSGAGAVVQLVEFATKYLEELRTGKGATDIIIVSALPTAGELNSNIIKSNVDKLRIIFKDLIANQKTGPILLIDNSKIEKMYRGISPAKFWQTINDTITGLFQMFNYLSKQESSYTSFDAEDYKTALSASGIAVIGVTKINTTADQNYKLSQALQDNFKKTLLSGDVDYTSAKQAACIIVADDNTMNNGSMDVVNHGFDAIHHVVGNATLHRGLYGSEKEGIRAYTLITGLELK